MEISSKSFFAIDDFTPRGKSLSFGDLVIKFSEKTSSRSDPSNPYEKWLRDFSILKKPDGALALILALSYTREGWSSAETSEKLIVHIFNLARNHQFQGKWDRVGEILQHCDLYTLGIHGILSSICKNMSEEDFFGNFLPEVYRIIEKNLILRPMTKGYRTLNKRERYRGIHRKVRRRGHDDKGSLKPNSLDAREVMSDVWVLEKESERKKVLERYHLKDPLSYKRYWYRSLFGIGQNDSTIRMKGEENYGRKEIQT